MKLEMATVLTMAENILWIFVGYFINFFIKKYKLIRSLNKTKNTIFKVSKHSSDDIYTISSPIPFYYSNDYIETKLIDDQEFFLSLPEDKKNHFNIDTTTFSQVDRITININFDGLGINELDFYNKLEEQRISIANDFAERKNGIYYNSERYGVLYSDDFGRTCDEQENTKLKINLFRTDYYTQKIVENTLASFLKKDYIDLDFLNKNMRGLRCSLGVSVIILLPSNEIILTRRSKNVSYGSSNKQWIYVSVTETFTYTDYDNYQKKPDITLCIERGLQEELGIDRNAIEKIKIYNMFYEKKFFQDNILAFVQLKKHVTYDVVTSNYAKDKELEVAEIIPVKNSINAIQDFISKNENDMRHQTKYALENYIARIVFFCPENLI